MAITLTYSIAEVILGVPYSPTHEINRLQLATLLTEIAGGVEALGLALGELAEGDILTVGPDGTLVGGEIVFQQQISSEDEEYLGSLVLFDDAGNLVQQLYADAGTEEGARAQIRVNYDAQTLAFRTSLDGTTWTDWITFGRRGADARPMVPAAGSYVHTGHLSGDTTTQAGVANRISLAPWVCPAGGAVDRLGIQCTTGVASAQARIVIYASDADGRPTGAPIFSSPTALDLATTGFKEETVALTFERGEVYWVGVHHSSTATISVFPAAGSPDIPGAQGTTALKTLTRGSVTFASGAPNPWTFAASEAATQLAPAIWMRKA